MAQVALKRIGSRDGAPVVLLHGFGGTMATWASVTPLLEESTDIVLADLPGHGGSLHAEGRGGAGRMAKAVLAALSAAGVEQFHLAGHSMGGAVSMLMALRAPARVLSLSLIAPGGMAPAINEALLADFARAKTVAELRTVLDGMVSPAYQWDEELLSDIAARRAEPGATEALAETYAAMFPEGPDRGQGTLPPDQLAGLAMPVAVLWGDADGVLPCPEAGSLPANFRLTTIAGAGHMLPEEAPDAVAALIRANAGLPE